MSSRLLSKNVKLCKTNLTCCLYRCETVFVTLRPVCSLSAAEDMVLRRVFGSETEEVARG
jgi:hypothetical protein